MKGIGFSLKTEWRSRFREWPRSLMDRHVWAVIVDKIAHPPNREALKVKDLLILDDIELTESADDG